MRSSNKLITLGLATALGFVGGYVLRDRMEPSRVGVAVLDPEDAPPAPPTRLEQVTPPAPPATAASIAAAEAPVHTTQAKPTSAAAETEPFRVTEEALATIEAHREHLRAYAESEVTRDGWRIRLKPDDKVFAAAGLHTGDTLTSESLLAELKNPERTLLAERMIEILQEIERD